MLSNDNEITRVIFLITYSPPYEAFENKPRPNWCWTKDDGTWIGIWGLDWGALLMRALVKYHDGFHCEIWQPDLRADKVYSAQLDDNLVHHSYPAKMHKRIRRNRIIAEIQSKPIVNQVKEHDNEDTVFMVPVSLYNDWLNHIITSITKAKILYYNFLSSELMLPYTINSINPLKILNRWLANKEKAYWLARVRNLLSMIDSPEVYRKLNLMYPKMNVFSFMWGYDLEYWKPVTTKESARKDLNISLSAFVIVLSQRLVPEYQIDKFIEALSKVQVSRNYICFITGHGLQDYEENLRKLVKQHEMQDVIHFVGYVTDDMLRSYFTAADLFVNLPITTAGSASALKATMVGTPVLQVPVGALYEFYVSCNAGEFVDPYDYSSWVSKLTELIEGKQIDVPERKRVEDYFSWERNIKDIVYAIKSAK